jgi:hypothetical protein
MAKNSKKTNKEFRSRKPVRKEGKSRNPIYRAVKFVADIGDPLQKQEDPDAVGMSKGYTVFPLRKQKIK